MRVAYLSTDEVNQSLAAEMGASCGVRVCPFAPKDGPSYANYDAVLCDWDSWPEAGRAAFLDLLKRGSLPGRLSAHGYNLTRNETITLLTKGVIVNRILKTEAFRLLSEPAHLPEPASATAKVDAATANTAPIDRHAFPATNHNGRRATVRSSSVEVN